MRVRLCPQMKCALVFTDAMTLCKVQAQELHKGRKNEAHPASSSCPSHHFPSQTTLQARCCDARSEQSKYTPVAEAKLPDSVAQLVAESSGRDFALRKPRAYFNGRGCSPWTAMHWVHLSTGPT
eukprot:1159964-Pelagomonas_calceolata.AAC.3